MWLSMAMVLAPLERFPSEVAATCGVTLINGLPATKAAAA
jgi:hypothetical protein